MLLKQPQPKEASNTKEMPFRNATRAVPEEQITTMMEMIPNEVQLFLKVNYLYDFYLISLEYNISPLNYLI